MSRETVALPLADHTAGNSVEENRVSSTCTVAGSYESVVYCSVCSDEMSRETVALPLDDTKHTAGDPVIENNTATCTEAGTYDEVVYCSACGAEMSRETKNAEATGHNPQPATQVTAPTCTEAGYTTYKCKTCKETYTGDETPAFGHNYESDVTAPTCTAEGYTTYTCANCGDTYTAENVPATGHSYEVSFVKNATCAKEGYTEYTCSACGDKYRDTIPAKNHKNEDGSSAEVEIPAVPATCTSTGYTAGMTCTICNTQTVVPVGTEKAEHAWDNGVVTEPTYSAQGYTTFTCENCGETKKDNFVPALEAEYTVAIRQPSITKIRCKDTIVLHTEVEGSDDYTVVWTADNENFVMTDLGDGKLEITSAEDGFTVFTATVFDAAGNEVGSDTVEMQSKADIWSKIGGFFRNLFGSTLYYNY